MSTNTKEQEVHTHDHDHGEVGHVHGPNCNHSHHHHALKPITRDAPKVGRNDPCPCGSEKKFKKCCGN
jgi:uncharacterized protein YecA (UPF0149 family)